MLSKASWLPLAQALSLEDGKSRRINHECGDGRTLRVSREGPTLRAFCHRCNDYGIHTVEENLSDRIARLNRSAVADADLSSSAGMPEGTANVSEWPTAARLWLAKAGLHAGDIGRLGAIYSPASGRVVLPCGRGFWQARAIAPSHAPKYIAPNVPKHYPSYGASSRITLTEDILSAYKVGQVGEGWPMLGTALPNELLSKILASGKEVNVWLDNDLPPTHAVNRGQIAARKVMRALLGAGVACRNIVTDKDPKLMHYEQIKTLVL